jgi:hypothetical protein
MKALIRKTIIRSVVHSYISFKTGYLIHTDTRYKNYLFHISKENSYTVLEIKTGPVCSPVVSAIESSTIVNNLEVVMT